MVVWLMPNQKTSDAARGVRRYLSPYLLTTPARRGCTVSRPERLSNRPIRRVSDLATESKCSIVTREIVRMVAVSVALSRERWRENGTRQVEAGMSTCRHHLALKISP